MKRTEVSEAKKAIYPEILASYFFTFNSLFFACWFFYRDKLRFMFSSIINNYSIHLY